MLKAGLQNYFVVFEKQTAQADDLGGTPSMWTEQGRCFIRLRPMGAYERMQSLKPQMKATHWCDMRNCYFDIDNGMRLRVLEDDVTPAPPATQADRVFLIEGVFDPTERGSEIRLMLTEIKGVVQ